MGQAPGNMGKGFRHTRGAKECISNGDLSQAIQEKVQESNDYLFPDGPRFVVPSIDSYFHISI
uniref:1-phosphatidylinositol-3-phosphate 5-kinase FAB1B n=1 Tax=Rhizophora mucronata TaxID=61149 RepID=A0A2P2JRI5_RHIMU